MNILINTALHMSDYADSIKINKTGTIFESDDTVNNLQEVLNKFGREAVDSDGIASTTKKGLVKLGGDVETDVLTTRKFIELATETKAQEEVLGSVLLTTFDGTGNYNDSLVITPKTFKSYFDDRKSSNDFSGTQRFSTKEEVDNRSGNTLITPKDLAYSLDTMIPKEVDASEESYGLVKLVSKSDLYGVAKNYDVGYAISPKTFGSSISNTTDKGIGLYANDWKEDELKLLDPKSLISFKNKNIEQTKKKDGLEKALQSEKIAFNKETERIVKESISRRQEEIMNSILRIGDILIMPTTKETTRLKSLNGQSVSRSSYPELFSIIGYKYGGSGNNFNLPDARGMTFKMQGKGGLITGGLGNIRSFSVGEMIPMRVAPHKHAGFGTVDQRGWAGFGEARTKNYWYHGTRNAGPRNGLRYGDYGEQNGIGENRDTRTWNVSLNYVMRVK